MLDRRTLGRLMLAVLVVGGAALAIYWLPRFEAPLADWADHVRRLGPLGACVLAALYVPLAVFMLPCWPLTWSAGFLLGLVPGLCAASVGMMMGALGGFLASRYLMRDFVRRQIAQRPIARAMVAAVERQSAKIVFLGRLSPLLPFNILNYVFGATDMPLGTYLRASAAGILPITALHVYLGTAIKSLADLARGNVEPSRWSVVTFAVGIAATLAATWLITKTAREALREEMMSD